MQRTTNIFRGFLHAGFVSLLILGASGSATIATAQSAGTFTATGNMTMPRRGHTATLLADGRVLIAGGWGVPENQGSLASAELYDPSTGKFTATGNMTAPRRYHTATLLPDGRVLIAGGTWASAEIYDPSTGTFSPTGNMITARGGHLASLLANGKVLIAGGFYFLASAELYDPATGTFSATEDMIAPNDGHGENPYILGDGYGTAILLPDGKVFIFGVRTSELYNPATDTFSLASGLNTVTDQWPDTQTLLTNGRVLVTGGDPESYGASAAAYVYDPSTGTFTRTGGMNTARDLHTATLLPDGTVLIAGGGVYGWTLTSAELYDPVAGAFSETGAMILPRCCQTATLLNDGQVLIAGGLGFGGNLATAELYTPPMLVPTPALFSTSGDGQGQGAILHAGTHQLASPDNPAGVGEALEIYCTGLGDGSVIPPQVSISGQMAEVLYFGKVPGLASWNQVNVRVPSGVAPGPAVPVRLTYLGRSSNDVTIAVR
jgi:galactose oxidase-like protein